MVRPSRLKAAKALEQKAIAAHDSLLIAEAWYLYGKMYVLAGEYRMAQAYFMKAFRIHEPRGDSYELNRLYRRLSENEERLGHFQKAVQLANRSLAIAQRIQSDLGLAGSYDVLGHIYETIADTQSGSNPQRYRQAFDCYRKMEAACYRMNDSMGVADASVNLGMLFTKTNDQLAVPYLKKAVSLFHPDNKIGNRIEAMLALASAYSMTGQTALALRTIEEAEILYKTKWTEDYTLLLAFERQYIRYYQDNDQWKEAFAHLDILNKLERSQLMADNNGAISRLNIEYETKKKENLLRIQSSELATLRLQKNFTLVTSVLLLLTAGLSVVFFRSNRKNKRISRINEELVREQNHRVKNNLQLMSSLLNLQAKRLTDPAAKKAIGESRLRLQSMVIVHKRLFDNDQLAKIDLADFFQELVDGVLNAYGFWDVTTSIAIDTITVSIDKAVPLGIILNELTTNICKYAFPDNDAPELRITCQRQKNKLHLTVTDNGPGMRVGTETSTHENEESEAVRKGSFGMQLIRAQVQQLNGTYAFYTNLENTHGGVVFTMHCHL